MLDGSVQMCNSYLFASCITNSSLNTTCSIFPVVGLQFNVNWKCMNILVLIQLMGIKLFCSTFMAFISSSVTHK
jgi:hypothetical protein